MPRGIFQRPEDPEETRKWEKQKQDEAQRSNHEDEKETKDWEDEKGGNGGDDEEPR
jgi:hypothetical protein